MGERLITYETIYEYLRNEKNKDALQGLDSAFFEDVSGYLAEKEQIYKDAAAKSDVFSLQETDKIAQQLRNVRNLISDLYTRREKKIIELAINIVRTRSVVVDASNVHKREKPFLNAVVALLEQYRGELLNVLLTASAVPRPSMSMTTDKLPPSQPPATPPPTSNPVEQPRPVTSPAQSDSPPSDPSPSSSTSPSSAPTSPGSDATKTSSPNGNGIMVEFLGSVDAFIDAELNEFGPYVSNDRASIPGEIASILIAEGKARKV